MIHTLSTLKFYGNINITWDLGFVFYGAISTFNGLVNIFLAPKTTMIIINL